MKLKRQYCSTNGNSAIKLSRAEIVERLEKGARQRCGVSARTLLRRYRHGKLDRSPIADLLALSNLLRKSDPLFAE